MLQYLNVGLVGCGHVSHFHIQSWIKLDDVTLIAFCDEDPGRAAAASALVPGSKVYSDAAEMMCREHLDIIDIATPAMTHATLVGLAAKRGIHALCQKPLANTLAEAVAIVELCKGAGVRLMVVEIARFLPWILTMSQNSALIGSVFQYRHFGERNYTRTNNMMRNQPYLQSQPQLIIRERIIHSIDASRFFVGDVKSIYARAHRINPVLAGEDSAVVVLGHRGGRTSVHDFSWVSAYRGQTWHGEELSIEGSNGALHFSVDTGKVQVVTDEILDLGTFDRSTGYQTAFDNVMRSFAVALRQGIPLEYSAEDNLNTLAATYAAYESIASGEVVHLA
jgi:D-apiose dehydrogenase